MSNPLSNILEELKIDWQAYQERERLLTLSFVEGNKIKRKQEIITILRSYKGKYLGDGIGPNVDALEIANLLEESIQ